MMDTKEIGQRLMFETGETEVEHWHEVDSLDGQEWSEWHYGHGSASPVEGLGAVTVVEAEGGEGQGDSASLVFRIHMLTGEIRYFRKEGFYASYDGFTWDGDFEEVIPRAKTITVYDALK